MKKVLIMAEYYVPSIKGGGPIQSIKNLVENLSDRIDFYIVAADRDLGDDKPFNNIRIDEWIKVGKANVYYTNTSNLTWKKIAELINSIDYDVIYLNSFFSYKDSIVPIILSKIKRVTRKPIVMAPRGQLSPGALGLKSRKKKNYIKIAKILGFYKNVIWHATADTEKRDIEAVIGTGAKIIVANNLTANYEGLNYEKNVEKKKGELKIVFVSRVHPKKNLKKAIEFLNYVCGEVEFNIYGPIEDEKYWLECEREIESLPKNIKVSYKGLMEHKYIIDVFKENHVFLFPTLGENFGHVISEAFIGGCPVIISDQTPWRDLEIDKIGWDIELGNESKFVEVLQECVNLGNDEYEMISKKAFYFGKQNSNKNEDIESTYNIFKVK